MKKTFALFALSLGAASLSHGAIAFTSPDAPFMTPTGTGVGGSPFAPANADNKFTLVASGQNDGLQFRGEAGGPTPLVVTVTTDPGTTGGLVLRGFGDSNRSSAPTTGQNSIQAFDVRPAGGFLDGTSFSITLEFNRALVEPPQAGFATNASSARFFDFDDGMGSLPFGAGLMIEAVVNSGFDLTAAGVSTDETVGGTITTLEPNRAVFVSTDNPSNEESALFIRDGVGNGTGGEFQSITYTLTNNTGETLNEFVRLTIDGTVPVPEPSSALLALAGLGLLARRRR